MRHYIFIIFYFVLQISYGQTLTATYSSSDIPTSFNTYSDGCNGSSTTLSVTLPNTGSSYTVTNVFVSYNMTASGSGFMSHQRSLIKFQNTNTEESEVSGTGNSPGTFYYGRNLSIANGTYSGGTVLVFQMKARRTVEGSPSGCNTAVNKVDNNSWSITVFVEDISRVGVGLNSPTQKMEVNGKIKIGDDPNTPSAGTIRWNAIASDFEGYDGTRWRSLTGSKSWGNNEIPSTNENKKVIAADGAQDDYFGNAVAISGDYAIIGACADDVGLNMNQGSAYIFFRNGSNWVQQAKLTASDGDAADLFGFSVAISGDYAIVGSSNADIGINTNQGAAYIFVRSGTNWTQQAKILASDGAFNDQFGVTVSISGDYAMIGAHLDDVGANADQGSAYVFRRSGTIWAEQSKLTASDGVSGDNFGLSVFISGTNAIVGSHNADINSNPNQGAAYIFLRSGTSWTQQVKIVASDGSMGDNFGFAVAISDNYAVIGANNDDTGSNTNQGSAYIFVRNGSNWTQQAIIKASDGSTNDFFGTSVSISGDYVIVGAIGDAIASYTNQGSAYIFVRSGTNWLQQTKLTSSDGFTEDNFGFSVFISGVHALVGANLNDGGFTNQGAAYFFSKN